VTFAPGEDAVRQSLRSAWGRQAALWVALALAALGGLALGQDNAAPAAQPAAGADAAAAGDEAAALPARGTHISMGWTIFFGLALAAWVASLEWVSVDTIKVKANQTLWNTGFFSAGLAGWALALWLHPVFAALTLAALICGLGVYVSQRNRLTPPEERLLTKQHLAFMASRWLARVGLKVAPEQLTGTKAATTEIVLLRKDGKSLDALSSESRHVGGSDASQAVKEIVESAVLSRTTDIHLEPKEGELQVRFRIDGILHSVPSYPAELAPPIISAIKVLSDMDIAERRKPQDGTFMGKLEGKAYDFRVATSPSVHGETMVIRILDRDLGLIKLERLGLDEKRLEQLRRIINAPNGLLAVSGPTGSGKTTTLYASLMEIDAFQKNIMTIENPIEYRLENVTQTQINVKAGVTFAGQLRSMLRQDPDVIMVGEIRDAETARTALQAAMTGHFVFTTIHANDGVSTLFRLLDLGVEPYLVSSSLTAILAQRLVRTLCENCKEPYAPNPDFVKKVGLDPSRVKEFYKAVGCESCQGTGYYGRIGIFELFEMNDVIRDLLRGQPSIQLIKAEARKAGLLTLQEDGLRKVLQGVTSIKELIRVTK